MFIFQKKQNNERCISGRIRDKGTDLRNGFVPFETLVQGMVTFNAGYREVRQ